MNMHAKAEERSAARREERVGGTDSDETKSSARVLSPTGGAGKMARQMRRY